MENLREWTEKLRDSGKAIIVEGKKDREALLCLGLRDIFVLSKKPLYSVIEDVSKKHCQAVILTDLDKEGKKLYGRLSSGLQSHGVEIDNRFREFLYKEKISHIEGLATYAAHKEVNLMAGGCCGGGKKKGK